MTENNLYPIKMERRNQNLIFNREIPAGDSFIINLSNKNEDDNGVQTDLYAPFKNLTIINNSTGASAEYYLNAELSGKLVPSGVITAEQDKNINNIRIKNLSSTTALKVTLQLDNDYSLIELKKLEMGINI